MSRIGRPHLLTITRGKSRPWFKRPDTWDVIGSAIILAASLALFWFWLFLDSYRG
jgi:hypothetical protein